MTHCQFAYNSFFYNKGNISQCCLQTPLFDELKLDWSDVSDLNQFYQLPNFSQIRTELEQGKTPSACNTCWAAEHSGIKSMRQENTYFNNVYDLTPKITHVDLRLSNKCNLACRMCNAHDSSQIAKIEGIDIPVGDTQRLMELVIDLPDLKSIRFAGGEPFVMPEVIDFLDKLVSLGRIDIEIEIITNCTSVKPSLIKILNQFRKVLIMASIDSVGEWFEFQRAPARWDTVHNNFDRIYNSNITIQLVPCIGSINLLGIPDFFKWANQYPQVHVAFNEITEPDYLNFRHVPLEDRERLWSEFSDMPLLNATPDWIVFKEKLMYEYQEPNQLVKNKIKDRNELVWGASQQQMKEVFPWIYI